MVLAYHGRCRARRAGPARRRRCAPTDRNGSRWRERFGEKEFGLAQTCITIGVEHHKRRDPFMARLGSLARHRVAKGAKLDGRTPGRATGDGAATQCAGMGQPVLAAGGSGGGAGGLPAYDPEAAAAEVPYLNLARLLGPPWEVSTGGGHGLLLSGAYGWGMVFSESCSLFPDVTARKAGIELRFPLANGCLHSRRQLFLADTIH